MKAKKRLRIVAPVVALFLVGLVVLIQRRHIQLYKVTALPSLGATFTRPEAINDRGQVTGRADVIGSTHLFLWDRENGMQDLGPALDRGPDINNAGRIAGTMKDPNGNMQAFLWDPKDGKQMLGTLGGAESTAFALNNTGQAVGFSDSVEGLPQPFVWDKTNGMQNLSRGGGRKSGMATAINDSGQVMGRVMTGADPPIPCFWDSTAPTATPAPPLLPPNDYRGGTDLNNNGCVLGKTYNWDKDETWTFLWTKETGIDGMQYLFQLEQSVGPLKFNDANQVLYGEKHTSSLERFSKKYFGPYTQQCLWDPKRGKIVLDKQIPSKLGKLVGVRDINNRGCIIGSILLEHSGQVAGVLLEPIPKRWDE